jgi:hypothetical protein
VAAYAKETEAKARDEALRRAKKPTPEDVARVNRALDHFEKTVGYTETEGVRPTAPPKPAERSAKERAEAVYNHPMFQATTENWKNSTAAATEAGAQNAVPGLKAPAIGTAGAAATAVGGVALSLGVGSLDPDVYVGVKALNERRGGKHPADKVEDDSAPKPRSNPSGGSPIAGPCKLLGTC